MKSIGYTGSIHFNSDQPDGTERKLLDTAKINQLGWKAKIELEEGIRMICEEFEMVIPS
jgi:GDP-L-fucose synthase